MTNLYEQGKMYRMPTIFGPRTGPRNGPDGRKFDNINSPNSTTLTISFLTKREQLTPFLPDHFELIGEPIVTVAASYITEIEWLAGRGYNKLGVLFPVVYKGEVDEVTGNFLTVLWENLADPIITGREELGFAKIYCELPEPTVLGGNYHAIASWMGFKFLDIHLTNLAPLSNKKIEALNGAPPKNDGTLHYKYMPRTGIWGTADIEYACLTPSTGSNRKMLAMSTGDGSLQFHQARWEDMPTQYNVVNAFVGLDILEYRGTSITQTVGGKDLSDQRILR